MAAVTEDGSRQVRAVAKWVRMSPRKARLVVDHIRGRPVPEARTVLAFTQRAAAREVEKVLKSAIANAEANHGLVGDDLLVSAAYVDEAVTMKRWRARARGRAARIRKPTCHITIALEAPQAGRPRTAPRAEEASDVAAEEQEQKPKRSPRRTSSATGAKQSKPKRKEGSAKKPEASSRTR